MNRKVFRLCFAFLAVLTFGKYSFGQHFTPPGQIYQAMNIIVTSATIGGEELESGDEIAVFDGDLCVGTLVLSGPVVTGTPVFVVATADDTSTPEKDGFTTNNEITFKIWDNSEGTEVTSITVVYSYDTNLTDVFTPLGTALVTLDGAGSLKTTAQTVTTCPGEVTVEVDVSNFQDVATYTLNLEYDNSKVSYQSYQNLNSSLNQSAFSVVNNGTSLSVEYNGTGTVSLVNGNMFELVFNALNTTVAASSDLQWNASSVYYDLNSDEITSSFIDGAINIDPIPATPSGITGVNEVCQGATSEAYSVVITNAISYSWELDPVDAGTVNGSGSAITIDFDSDYQGSVELSAKGTNACGDGSPASININVEANPAIDAGVDGEICEDETYSLNATASAYASVIWTTTGDGTFDDVSILTAVYTPGATDKLNGSVTLNCTANANSPCTTNAQDGLVLTIGKAPSVDAGSDAQICETDTYTLAAIAQDYNTFGWITSGDGTFDDATLLSAVYTPGANDILNGTVTLTSSVTPDSPCANNMQDELTLSIQKAPVVAAGDDASICETETYSLNGSAQYYSTVLWTTAGDGTFDDATILSAVYTPGANDKTSGSVELSLTVTASAPCTATNDDVLTLNILTNPSINAGTDFSICENGNAQLGATGDNYESIIWTTAGDGSFDDNSILNAVYTPGANDLTAGFIALSIEALGAGSCTNTNDQLDITIIPLAQADAGDNVTICESETCTLSTASANNQSAVLWTTAGDGVFDNTALLNAVYTPGANDIANGTVELTLEAQSQNPCTESANDAMTLSIQKNPTADAGADFEVCESGVINLNATVANYSSIEWTSAGNGSFDDASLINAVYTPGSEDVNNGYAVLTLNVNATTPCTNVATDEIEVTIAPDATVNAGSDLTICETASAQLAGGAEYYQSVLWTTAGDGSFDDANILNAVYTPGVNDILVGSITVTLTAKGQSPCTAEIQDELIITIQPAVVAVAGDDAAICATDTYTLNGSAENHTAAVWTTAGDGSFNNAVLLDAVYTPGANDKTNGSVELTLTAAATAPCATPDDDVLNLSILTNPSINAGTDLSICETANANLAATGNNYESILWTTAGDGSFDDNSILNAVYTPGANDLTAGSVVLNIEAVGAGSCSNTSDEMTISFAPEALVSAGDDATICESETIALTSASADNHGALLWTTNGDGAFDNVALLNAVYTPGTNDISNGTVTLTLEAQSQNPCTEAANDAMTLTIQKNPTADAGADFEVCESDMINLNATVENYSTIEWTSAGNGSFDDASLMNAVYTPGSEDVNNGYAVLTLNVNATTPCTIVATDEIEVTLAPDATVNAGSDLTICETASAQLAGGAEYYQSVVWTTAGDGSFDDANILNAVYTPGSNDILAGSISLILTAKGQNPCTAETQDELTITIQPAVVVLAGDDAAICATDTYTLNGSAENHTAVVWTTAGDGSFDNAVLLDALYTPGADDKNSGSVVLTLTATATAPCTATDNDVLTLSIMTNPSIEAGVDLSICETANAQLTATGDNFESVLWTTGGDGSFDDNSILNAVYTPGVNDLTTGSVALNIEAAGAGSCSNTSDELTVSFNPEALVSAGDDATICESETYTLTSATANNNGTLLWVTNGDGSFDDAGLLNAIYTPGTNDILNGSVELTLEAQSLTPCTEAANDAMTLTIQNDPTVDAGTDFDVCESAVVNLNATVDNYSTLEWSSNGSGTFDDATLLTAVYTPSAEDLTNGTITFTLNVNAITPCTAVADDDVVITFKPDPTVDAGDDVTICESTTAQLQGVATNYDDVAWTTAGDGSFDDVNILNAVYTPGVNDILAGSITLTLTAQGQTPCDNQVDDQMVITLQPDVVVNAGDDVAICETDTYTLNATAQNQTDVTWSTAGDGSFDDVNILNAVYTPGDNDKVNGSVELTLTATATAPCTASEDDILLLSILTNSTVDAGEDLLVCENANVQLAGTGDNYESINWTTAGDGSFDDASIMNAVYTPGANDITNGSIELTLNAQAAGSCQGAEDVMVVSLAPLAEVNAGGDASVCIGNDFAITNAVVSNSSVFAWATAGDGTFDDETLLNPVYTPGATDLLNGSVELSLEAESQTPCTDLISDTFVLSIQNNPTADAGADAEVCEDLAFEITDATAGDYGSIVWTTSGDGIFNDNSLMNPTYSAGETDGVNGTVTLTMTVNAASPCVDQLTETKVLTVTAKPEVNAGADAVVCEDETVQFSVTASNYASILWSSTGDGTFNSNTNLITVYTPGPADVANGTATISVMGVGYGVCTTPATDQLTLTIQPLATLEAGDDLDICETETCALQAIAQNYSSVEWISSGDGSFTDNTSLTPVYTPGTADIQSGAVTLSISLTSEFPCDEILEDVIEVSIQQAPEVAVGDDVSICEDETVSLNAAALHYNSLTWSTSGDGSFSDASSLTAVYTPGNGDITSGSAVLTLTVEGIGACDMTETDALTVNITQSVTVDAGDNLEICSDENAVIFADVDHSSTILWTTSGDGSFSDPAIEDAVYTPGANDVADGNVTLTLTAQAISPCTGSASDDIFVSIIIAPEQPEQPTGDDQILIEYDTPPVYGNYETAHQPGVIEYFWEIEPVNAGVVVDNGSRQVEIEWLPTFGPEYAYVKVKTINDCGISEFSESFEVFVDNHVGVDKFSNQSSIQLTPNPGDGLVMINTQGLDYGNYTIQVLDANGKTIAKHNLTIGENQQTEQLDLRSCASGTYHVQILNNNFKWSGQLVIRK